MFRHQKGCLYLEIDQSRISKYIEMIKDNDVYKNVTNHWFSSREKRDGEQYHITILPSFDTKQINTTDQPQNVDFYILGAQFGKTSIYLPCHYPAGDAFRKKH